MLSLIRKNSSVSFYSDQWSRNLLQIEEWAHECNQQIQEFEAFQLQMMKIQTFFNRLAFISGRTGEGPLKRRRNIIYYDCDKLPELEPFMSVKQLIGMGKAFSAVLSDASEDEKKKILKGLIKRAEPLLPIIQKSPRLLNLKFEKGKQELQEMCEILEAFLSERIAILEQMKIPLPSVIEDPFDAEFIESRLRQTVEYFESATDKRWMLSI